MKARRHKYGAQPTVVDGVRFASKKEANRYRELKLLEKAGEIDGLLLQPAFDLLVYETSVGARLKRAAARMGGQSEPKGLLKKIGTYRADFSYWQPPVNGATGQSRRIVEDVKGFRTPLYKWKKRHVEAQYGIQIREV